MFEKTLWKLRWICLLCFGKKSETLKQIDRLKACKENIRGALLRAGYEIPPGLRMDEWVSIIDERTEREKEAASHE